MNSSKIRFSFAFVLCLAATVPASAQDPVEIYDALRAAQPDGRALAVSGLTWNRDVYEFRFDSGTIYPLAPVAGRTVGAVFLGDGSLTARPVDPRERRHLSVVVRDLMKTGEFDATFDRAVLWFTDDDVWESWAASGTVSEGAETGKAASALASVVERQRDRYETNFHLRVLQAMMHSGEDDDDTFFAFLDGGNRWPIMVVHDGFGGNAVRHYHDLGGEESYIFADGELLRGLIYSGHSKDEFASGTWSSCRRRRLVDPTHYRIETRLGSHRHLEATAETTFVADRPVRVLPVDLYSWLRIESVEWVRGDGTVAVPFVQEPKRKDADVAVLFPEPLPVGEPVTLRFVYSGQDVLEDAGEGNFYINVRTSWYPNLGLFDPATFDLTFRHPPQFQVISVGTPAGAGTAEGEGVSHWKSEVPMAVAGFNYGKFKKIDDAAADMEFAVYTNPGEPAIVKVINSILSQRNRRTEAQFAADVTQGDAGYEGYVPGQQATRESFNVNTQTLAKDAMADATNMAKVMHLLFGATGHGRVSVTQQTNWAFGQAWPTLIYLPYISFLSSTERAKIGMEAASEFVDEVGLHEMAHQWWGHEVRWDGYRDQWISEGFAEFFTGYALEVIDGPKRMREFWRDRHERIVENAKYDAGGITQGFRLPDSDGVSSYGPIVYSKGAFVLHMLRHMMRDPKAKVPDERFFAMMKDFYDTHRGGAPSTEDFKATVQKHFIPELNARGDGTIDWFFDQWVYGTEVPEYEADFTITRMKGKTYRVSGTFAQKGVSEDFMTIVPLYIDFGKKGMMSFGRAPFKGNMSHKIEREMEFPAKPKGVVANANFEVLAR